MRRVCRRIGIMSRLRSETVSGPLLYHRRCRKGQLYNSAKSLSFHHWGQVVKDKAMRAEKEDENRTQLAVNQIVRATTDSEIRAVRDLFEEYAASIGVDLCFQNFEHELSTLPGAYGP